MFCVEKEECWINIEADGTHYYRYTVEIWKYVTKHTHL
jgi:hypothetical protein